MARTCVFCSSSTVSRATHGLARELGRAIAEDGDELVYGGTATGLMVEVADGARGAGGRVVGVVPSTIAALGSVDRRCDELVEVETLGERKVEMMRGSHRVVALVGGIGTLDEVLEALTFRQLGLLAPDVDVVLLDPEGFWDPLLAQLDAMRAAGTLRPGAGRLRVARTVGDVIDPSPAARRQ